MSPSPDRGPGSAPIVAGTLLVGSMLLGAGAGFALGSLAGIAVLTGLVGLFVGLILGFVLVHDRYRHL